MEAIAGASGRGARLVLRQVAISEHSRAGQAPRYGSRQAALGLWKIAGRAGRGGEGGAVAGAQATLSTDADIGGWEDRRGQQSSRPSGGSCRTCGDLEGLQLFSANRTLDFPSREVNRGGLEVPVPMATGTVKFGSNGGGADAPRASRRSTSSRACSSGSSSCRLHRGRDRQPRDRTRCFLEARTGQGHRALHQLAGCR